MGHDEVEEYDTWLNALAQVGQCLGSIRRLGHGVLSRLLFQEEAYRRPDVGIVLRDKYTPTLGHNRSLARVSPRRRRTPVSTACRHQEYASTAQGIAPR